MIRYMLNNIESSGHDNIQFYCLRLLSRLRMISFLVFSWTNLLSSWIIWVVSMDVPDGVDDDEEEERADSIRLSSLSTLLLLERKLDKAWLLCPLGSLRLKRTVSEAVSVLPRNLALTVMMCVTKTTMIIWRNILSCEKLALTIDLLCISSIANWVQDMIHLHFIGHNHDEFADLVAVLQLQQPVTRSLHK